MDGNFGFLFAALAITWLGIAAYVMYVSGRVTGLARQLDELRRLDLRQLDQEQNQEGR
jgi:CcmD family protein